MADKYIQVVQPTDNVATALRALEAGEAVTVAVGDEERTVEVNEDVRFGHKIAIEEVGTGDTVTKYGKSIGNAIERIAPGDWVHVHNVESNYGRGDIAGENRAEAIHE
ncbi:UxaA family hydrolase [Halomarina pelagica]|uniref:UxaA family hydrolase n=1 Tax=Halomarina pelagica TaxID=2961599 RepID=UPI0020C1E24F|nr:UxaA family hydrolase [Halomarina sp. BND7]